MTRHQVEHLDEVRRLWLTFGPALRTKAGLTGGITWKKVKGADYLCRYWQDPETGKKKFTSLGRRSPETEEAYRMFMESRAVSQATISANADALALAGRVSKAYRVARMPVKTAEVIREFWLASLLDEDLMLIGGTALFAYEADTEVLAPAELAREDFLTFMVRHDLGPEFIARVQAAYEHVTGRSVKLLRGRQQIRMATDGMPIVTIITMRHVFDQFADATDFQIELLNEAFAMPATTGITVARDTRPVEITAPDLRAYALISYARGARDDVEMERSRFAAALVRERSPAQFDPRQEAAFPEV
jgi:hypothetical protein